MMNYRYLTPATRIPVLGLTAIAALSLTAFLAGQDSVVIESGPGGVQISDRDGEIEGTPMTPEDESGVSGQTREEPTDDSGVRIVRPVSGEDLSLFLPAFDEGTDPAEEAVDIIADVEPGGGPIESPVVDVARQRQLTRMEKELGIAVSGGRAVVTYEAGDLFGEAENSVNSYAQPTLNRLGRYLALAKHEKVSLTYHYHEETTETARKRGENLANYLADQADVDKEIVESDAKPVGLRVAEEGRYQGALTPEFRSLIRINMIRN